MKLYFSPGSCGLATQIALREAGQAFDLVKVDFKTKMTVEGDYYKVNSKGFVPALITDDGDVLTEGAVILQWIADKHPQARLLPAYGTMERYRALEWLNFIATDLHKNFAVLFSSFLNKATKDKFAEGNLNGKFDYLDQYLSRNEYLLGKAFSVADAYLFNVLTWPERVNVDISKYAFIQKFMARMAQRPSVSSSWTAEGLPARP